jgi:hypothetical protein
MHSKNMHACGLPRSAACALVAAMLQRLSPA